MTTKQIDLIQAALNKSTVNVEKAFNSLIAKKIEPMLKVKKAEVAANLFNQAPDTNEE